MIISFDQVNQEPTPMSPLSFSSMRLVQPSDTFLFLTCIVSCLRLKVLKSQLLIFTDLISSGKSLQACMADGSLFTQCERRAEVSLRALDLSLQLAAGLAHIHSCMVIHYDLKVSDGATRNI